jgi:putative SOS response-associated peptidase YedK
VTAKRPTAAGAGAAAGGKAGTARDEGGKSGGEARELRVVRWGLVPFWAKDKAIGSRMINARAETVDVKPAFRGAFARRRCLPPADGYYEWYRPGSDAKAATVVLIHRRTAGRSRSLACTSLWTGRFDDHLTRGCGQRLSLPPARRMNSAGSTSGCRW